MSGKMQFSDEEIKATLATINRMSAGLAAWGARCQEAIDKLEEIKKWVINCDPPKKPSLPTAHEETVERVRGILGLDCRC